MDWWLLLSIIIACLLVLLAIGIPVAFAFLLINLVGVYILWSGEVGIRQLILSIYSSVTIFTLLPVPLFVLMGELMFRSGIGFHMMEGLDKWIGRLPGRLSLLAVGGGALFSTLSGSAMASTAMLGSVLVPEMERRGYKKPMSLGPILGSGGLAMMIPPSAVGVLLATLGRIPVGKFLLAIIVPGLIMAALYTLYIVGRCWLQPQLAPPYDVERISLREKLVITLRYIVPLGSIVFLVIGLIILGVATPTEASALGALGCLVLARLYGGLTWRTFVESMAGTLRVTVMMLMILTGSTAFSQILAFSGATRGLVEIAVGLSLPPVMLLVVMQAILLLMGTFMEPLSIMVVTLPVYMPIAQVLGFDMLWFGAIILINMQMATTTPPFGLSLFVMKSVVPRDTTMGDIYRGALPFLVCDAVAMGIMIAFPALVLWLPGVLR